MRCELYAFRWLNLIRVLIVGDKHEFALLRSGLQASRDSGILRLTGSRKRRQPSRH